MSDDKYSPSMVDGKIVRLSVSQLSRFDRREHGGCERKWWFRYVGKVPDPPSPPQAEGIAGHARFEDYYSGKPVVWMDMDLPALKELPQPGPGVSPEVKLERVSCLRIPLQGSIDLVHGNDAYDYKYQGKIRVYSEPTAQLWGYLEELRLRDNTGGRLSFHHVYIQKKAPYQAKKVTQCFEPREVERKWLTYGSLVKEMQDVAAEPDVAKVEKNLDACFAYGPCPYLGICNRHTHIEQGDAMNFLEELQKAQREAAEKTAAVQLPVIDAPPIKALPPDAPAPDAIPTAPSPPAPPAAESKKRGPGRPKKETKEASGDADDVGGWSRPPPPVLDTPRVTSVRWGLTIGLPGYSSMSANAEVTGTNEEEMTKACESAVLRQLTKMAGSEQVQKLLAEAEKRNKK